MLEKRCPPPEWALMQEVAPATGGGTRYADAIAVNLWRSRGHAIHGFEVKVSRSDWQRELKDPAKAEPLYRYCDHWWIVAPAGVVKPGELPPTWGLLRLTASGLIQEVAAPLLQAQPIDRTFFASLMRRGHEQIEQIADRKQRLAIQQARAEIDNRIEHEVKSRSRELEEWRKHAERLKAATGLEFSSYAGPPIEVIQLAQRLSGLKGYKGGGSLQRLVDLAEQLDTAAKTVREAVAASGLGGAE